MSNVSADQALAIFDDKAAQQRFLDAQSARFVQRVDAAPSQTGGAAAAAAKTATLGERSVSKFQDQFDSDVGITQSLIQDLAMKPNKALLFMITKRIGEDHGDAQAVYFAYRVLSGLEVFSDKYKQGLLNQVKEKHVNYNAVDKAIAAGRTTFAKELEAVKVRYKSCAAVDWETKFPKGYTKDSVWNSLFGPLTTADGQVNPASLERIMDYYGCLPIRIPLKRWRFMTEEYVKLCARLDQDSNVRWGETDLIIAPPLEKYKDNMTVLDIGRSNLRCLPPSIEDCTGLRIFALSKTPDLERLPNFDKFPDLEELRVRECPKVRSLGDLSTNEKLRDLDASSNNLTGPLQLPTSLVDLNLSHNKQLNFSDFSTLSDLESLNQISTGLQDFPQLPAENALQELSLGSNAISALPASLAHLSGLKTLDISENQLTDVRAITQLTALETLDIVGTGLTTLPDLSALKQLKKVKIGDKHRLDAATMAMLGRLKDVKITQDFEVSA